MSVSLRRTGKRAARLFADPIISIRVHRSQLKRGRGRPLTSISTAFPADMRSTISLPVCRSGDTRRGKLITAHGNPGDSLSSSSSINGISHGLTLSISPPLGYDPRFLREVNEVVRETSQPSPSSLLSVHPNSAAIFSFSCIFKLAAPGNL